ncbi:homocysteine S-methyltransferase family protein [Pseudogemmobacter faecipullorum]|nr:homocysteine S-methyltransferase family protein [Pseudogemmobacter faecipullorum]
MAESIMGAAMGRIFILDGGMGRELLRRGAPFRQPEWSALALIEAPEHVSAVHDDYIHAGADMITTNSYAVVPFHIGAERFEREGLGLAQLSGRLARESAARSERKIIVAGSLPPVLGSYRPDLFDKAEARRLLSVLITGLAPYVDVWLAETLSSVEEAETVRELLAELLPGDSRPLWVSFTLEDIKGAGEVLAGRADPVLRSGEKLAGAVLRVRDLGAEVLLFNCSQAEFMEPAIRIARQNLEGHPLAGHIGAYANTFVPVPEGEDKVAANGDLCHLRGDLEPAQYAAIVQDWIAAGASYAGGCCGIGPDHICALHHDHAH